MHTNHTMKEFLLPFFGFQFYVAATVEANNPLWERLLEKWGIGFIGIGLLYFLAQWTAKRDEEFRKKQSEREEEVRESLIAVDRERSEREIASSAERAGLLARNNELQEQQLKTMSEHATRLEQLTKDGTKAVNDTGASMRMLVRKMQRPCVAPFTLEEQKDHEG